MVSDVFFSASAFFVDAAVSAAHDVGLFAALPASLSKLSGALGIAPRALRILVDVLKAHGAVAVQDGRLMARTIPPRPRRTVESGWGRLAEVLRSGRPLDETAHTAEFHQHLYERGRAAADALMARLAPTHTGSLLDIGGGQGTYTRAWLAQDGHTATLVDAAPVVALARSALAPFGARVRFLAGDFLDEEPGDDLAVALLADVLHLHPPAICAALIARAATSVAPGGIVAVKEIAVTSDRSGPLGALLFGLNMVVYTDGGDVYDAEQISGFMRAAGLVDVETITLTAAPESVVVRATQP